MMMPLPRPLGLGSNMTGAAGFVGRATRKAANIKIFIERSIEGWSKRKNYVTTRDES
jgi:hypothetical protein